MYDYDEWATVYDQFAKGVQDDIVFYKKEAKKARGKVLEVACGTGRVYLELLKAGVDIYGFDISSKMLAVLNEKAKKAGLKTKVKRADMRAFKFNCKFSAVLIPYRAFLHNITIEDQLKTLKNIHRHLLPNGKLILNFFYPLWEVIFKTYGKILKTKVGNMTMITKSQFVNQINQIIGVNFKFKKGSKIVMQTNFQLAHIYKREFELLLKLAGFKKWKVYGGFNYKPLKSREQEMVWVAEK